MKKSPAFFAARAGIIAAVYAVITVLQNIIVPGSASLSIQVRIAEALSVLSVLDGAAIPGITIGCATANIFSAGALPFDALFGSVSTFLAGIMMYRLRSVRIKGMPLLSCCMPVIFNAVFIGAELALFMPFENKSRLSAFIIQALSVAAGEAVSVFLLGLPLFKAVEKRNIFNKKY